MRTKSSDAACTAANKSSFADEIYYQCRNLLGKEKRLFDSLKSDPDRTRRVTVGIDDIEMGLRERAAPFK